ncbi:conserved hypothetical protein [Thioalkalivibrio sulfidiphilus HL-EbGr7]|uniref:Small multi-drug export protein n=1 Tax=Thioalkalivibrio sulfidiphilus (strain HL-EbGR7) TaxID=396588 RepID=B8GLW6_THISH|nr:small multi-drug export protein [Thioalkalivibrio sulfidiphilus]ACL71719.1 conserved hypothetical protein [Thioalkalivibrio sulfidiphilus HL-EbGr7]
MTRQGLHLRLLASTEGRLLYLGAALSLALLAALLTAWTLSLDNAYVYAVMTGLNLVIGRAAGMSFGYASGLGHAQVVPLNMLVESIHVLVVYPLFALSWWQLVRLRALKPFFARMHQAASTRSGAVRRYGIAGLFLFVFMPFWMTGPVVGAIIGFLIGLRPWVNVTVVLLSTYVAIGIWALLLNELSAWAETISRFAPYAVVLAIVLIALVMQLLYRRRARHKP